MTGCARPPSSLALGLSVILATPPVWALDKAEVVQQNADIAHAAYSDSLAAARELERAIDALIDSPNDTTLNAAREAWKAAREPYGQTEVYRFRGGPIDDLSDAGELVAGEGPEGRINAWPLDEALIDYVAGAVDGNAVNEDQPSSALIEDVDFAISKESLAERNELGGNEANVTTGYHAIEFLLWGQDLNAGETSWDGQAARDATPGHRPATDFASDDQCSSGIGSSSDPTICERRGQYLKAAAALLIDDLSRIVAAWDPNGGDNYYQQFTAAGNVDASLLKMLVGMGSLSYGELAGERMLVALAADSQEDEHSCFSDNTHRDILLNALGIQNTYLGRYQRTDGSLVEGAGLTDLVAATDPARDQRMQTLLENTMTRVSLIDQKAKYGVPFDLQIAQFPGQDRDGRPVLNANMADNLVVNDAISALRAQTRAIEEVIRTLLGDVDFEIEDSPAFM